MRVRRIATPGQDDAPSEARDSWTCLTTSPSAASSHLPRPTDDPAPTARSSPGSTSAPATPSPSQSPPSPPGGRHHRAHHVPASRCRTRNPRLHLDQRRRLHRPAPPRRPRRHGVELGKMRPALRPLPRPAPGSRHPTPVRVKRRLPGALGSLLARQRICPMAAGAGCTTRGGPGACSPGCAGRRCGCRPRICDGRSEPGLPGSW